MARINNLINYSRLPQSLLPYLTGAWLAKNNANDELGVLNGTYTGAHYSNGKNGQAFDFGSGSQTRYITFVDNDLWSFTDGVQDIPASLSMWVYFYSISPTYGNWLINKRQETPINKIEWQLNYTLTSNSLAFMKISEGNVANRVETRSITNPSLSNWHHIVYTTDGTKFGDKLYLNGVDNTSTHIETGTYVKMNNTNSNVVMGVSSWNLPTYALETKHRGMLDEVYKFKGTTLTPAQVLELYNAGAGKFYPNI